MTSLRRYEEWNPFRELDEIRGRFDRLLGLGGVRERLASGSDFSPACNVRETPTEYRVDAELPSVKKEDVHVTVEGGVLSISGERKQESEQKDEKYHRREVSYGRFERRFDLPEDADTERIDATFKDGMLSVIVPKQPQGKSTARQVQVH